MPLTILCERGRRLLIIVAPIIAALPLGTFAAHFPVIECAVYDRDRVRPLIIAAHPLGTFAAYTMWLYRGYTNNREKGDFPRYVETKGILTAETSI